MKKQSFLYGSFILVSSVIITKIIGILFKIPLANILGGTGMGYFSCAYAIFMPVYAISVTGLPAAVSRIVAENMAFKKYANVRKIRRVALLGFSAVGLLSGALIFALAGPFTKYVVENEGSLIAVYAIAPCVLFGAMVSVYRGYFEGMRNMFPTAVSQIIESIAKLVAGLGFAYLAIAYTQNSYYSTGVAFGVACSSLEEALQISLPYVAAAAIAGVTLSTGISLIYLVIRYRFFKDGITKQMLVAEQSTERGKVLLKNLFRIVIPIALGSVITNLTSLIDLGTIIRSLNTTIENYPDYFINKYSYILNENMALSELPIFIYGSFSGLAITIFNLVPSITNMFGKGILPNLAEAWYVNNKRKVNKNIHSVIAVTGIICIPAGMGISILAKPILHFLYSSRPDEIMTVENSVVILGIGVIFLSLSVPAFAILQAIGRADLPVKIMLLGVIIKLIGNITLIYIPEINVDGAAISTTACYFFICIISLLKIKSITGIRFDVLRLFIKPSLGALLCSVAAYLSYDLMFELVGNKISVLIAIAAGGLIYILSLYLMNINNGKSIKQLFFK